MAKYIFNPFTQNFTVIPQPAKEGFFQLAARNGKLEWVPREDPMAKTVTINFQSSATQYVSSEGLLPAVRVARADKAYWKTISEPGTYSHQVLIDPTATDTSSYLVGLLLGPDQRPEINLLPATAITATPLADKTTRDVVAFIYRMTFTGDAAVNITVYDL